MNEDVFLLDRIDGKAAPYDDPAMDSESAPESRIDIRRVARAVSAVEDRRPEAVALLREAYALQHAAPVIGVTGPPGAGKSTLLDALALHWAEAGLRVALLLVDPSSPFTGGALLGDRCRMDRAGTHPNVFVRSLSSRGHLGGLSRAAQDVAVLLGAMDFDLVVVETVGSGQSDIEIARVADCVVVVSVPGLGDQLQAAKAGILEVGDVYAVNKSDTPGADAVVAHLRANLDLAYSGREGVNPRQVQVPGHGMPPANEALQARHGSAGQAAAFWRPPVLPVSASMAEGTRDLAQAIDSFLQWQRATGHDRIRRAERVRSHVLRLASDQLIEELARQPQLASLLQAVDQGRSTPDAAASELLDALLRSRPGS
jgi:LAO/AO transport system kinase